MESPFFFENHSESMFGVLHAPDNRTPDAGILLCHAFGEEKLWSHRVHVNLAREAASRGTAVFRFDFRGSGDSAGHSEDCTINSYLSDIDAAIAAFRSACPKIREISLIGLRFGATMAFLYANRNEDIRRLVLWEPVIDGARYMQELLRINLSTQLAIYGSVRHNREALVEQMLAGSCVNVDGYLVSKNLYLQSSEVDLLETKLGRPDLNILVTQIAPNIKQKDRADLQRLVAQQTNADFLKVEEPPFWREIKPFSSRAENLVGQTLDWWERKDGN